MNTRVMIRLLAAISLWVCVEAQAGYSALYVIGDSLSDSGNNAVVLAPNVTPVSAITNTFIPTFPYPSAHYTNGLVWAQTFAPMLGLSAAPSLVGGGDYAFGGARSGPLNLGGLLDPAAFPPSLLTQTAAFLASGPPSLSSALFVIAGGGNEARDALAAIGAGASVPVTIGAAATQFATNLGNIVDQLQAAGGQNIIVWNAPPIGLAPAVRASGAGATLLATTLTASMNAAMSARLGGESGVRIFDLFDLVTDIAADPTGFGLINVTDACGAFSSCDPSKYLFWDGIHPTSAGHSLIANAMFAALVPEPSSYMLVLVGLIVLTGVRKLPNSERLS
jgi:outer membrane lipase/esterase